MALQKQYLLKVYQPNGTGYVKTFAPPALKDQPPSFKSRMNGGLGECVLDLNLPFDNFDEGTSVKFMNVVDIYAVDASNPLGRRIYRGFVSKYEPYLDGRGEGVRVTLLGLVSLLAFSYYKTGASFMVTHSAQDPTVIAKAVIDHFNTVYGGSLVGYDAASVPATVGSSVSVTYTDSKWADALAKAQTLASGGWWWSIDRGGKFHFKAKPSSATHTFTIGKDVESLNCPKDGEKVVNDLQVRRSGGTASNYADATSQATYGTGVPGTGLRTEILSDTGLTDAAAADQRGNAEIANKKDAQVKATLVVNNKYDIDAIQPGDTCKVRNFRLANTFFSSNLQIVELLYRGDTVQLELEQQNADFGLELERFVNG